MKFSPKYILELVTNADVAFKNAKETPEILENVSDLYPEESIDQLIGLVETVVDKNLDYEDKYGKQLESTSKLNSFQYQEMSYYRVFRNGAKRKFEGEDYKGFRSQLGLDIPPRKSTHGFIEQAHQFYKGYLDIDVEEANRATPFIGFSLNNERAAARLQALDELKKLNENQEKAIGEARVARKERDKVTRNLRSALQGFKEYCRVQFKDSPEYLNILNIKPSRRGKNSKKNGENQDDQTTPPDTGQEIPPDGNNGNGGSGEGEIVNPQLPPPEQEPPVDDDKPGKYVTPGGLIGIQ